MPPSCRLQNVLIYFLEIQVIPEVEQRTIKLLSNKGHLPSTTSIKKAERCPRLSPGWHLPWQGDTQHTATQPVLSWAPQEPAPVMTTPRFGENWNSLATNAEEECAVVPQEGAVRKMLLECSTQHTPTVLMMGHCTSKGNKPLDFFIFIYFPL